MGELPSRIAAAKSGAARTSRSRTERAGVKGWLPLYRLSVGLGLRSLRRQGVSREAVIRIVVPMDPARYLELPWALEAVALARGATLIDLASPKLLAVALARSGLTVTSVDAFADEIDRWRDLVADEPRLAFCVGDGRSLPFESMSFDGATCISVLEHIGGPTGDAEALRELVRCVRPGGRIVVTLPYAESARDEFRSSPLYGEAQETPDGYFFQRWYDASRVDGLLDSVEGVKVRTRQVVGLRPDLDAAYTRLFPWLVPLGPLFGLLATETRGPRGHVQRLVLERC